MPKIAPFEDIRASLRDAVCFWRFQTRAKARGYARLSLSRQGQTGNRKGVRLESAGLPSIAVIASFEDIRTSLRDTVCFRRFQTRAKARGYLRLPLSRQGHITPVCISLGATKLSALADSERSPAIYRRVSVEKWIRRRLATVEPKGIASNSMNGICSAEFGRRYATRVCFCGCQTRAQARAYARLPLSRQDLSALADGERSPAIYRRVWLENERLVA